MALLPYVQHAWVSAWLCLCAARVGGPHGAVTLCSAWVAARDKTVRFPFLYVITD